MVKYAVTVTFFLDPEENPNLEDEECAYNYIKSNLDYIFLDKIDWDNTTFEIAEVSTINE